MVFSSHAAALYTSRVSNTSSGNLTRKTDLKNDKLISWSKLFSKKKKNNLILNVIVECPIVLYTTQE